MVLQQMPDHQAPVALLREAAEALGLDQRRGRAASRQRHACRPRARRAPRGVLRRRGGNRDGGDRRIVEHVVQSASRGVEAFDKFAAAPWSGSLIAASTPSSAKFRTRFFPQ